MIITIASIHLLHFCYGGFLYLALQCLCYIKKDKYCFLPFIYFFNNFVLIIWAYWVFAAARVFSSCGEQELLSSCNAQASHCSGFSWCRAQGLGRAGFSSCSTQLSSRGSQALDHRVNSCGPWAELLCSTWDLPGSGIEPMFPAVAGGFFTTESPGQPSVF